MSPNVRYAHKLREKPYMPLTRCSISSAETALKVLHLSHGVEQIRSGWKRGSWMWSDAEPKEQLLARDRAMSLMGNHLWVCIFILTRSCHDKEGQRSSITLSVRVCVKCSGRTTCWRWRRCRVAGYGQLLSTKAPLLVSIVPLEKFSWLLAVFKVVAWSKMWFWLLWIHSICRE